MTGANASNGSAADFARYFVRNIDQARELQRFRVLVVGVGTTGSHVAMTLAKAGVGSLILLDPDIVESANLHRQPIGARFIGMNKAIAMAETIRAEVSTAQTIDGWQGAVEDFNDEQLRALLSYANLVVAATGSDAADLRLNRECRDLGIDLIMPSLYPDSWRDHVGRVQVIAWSAGTPQGACVECLYTRQAPLRTGTPRGALAAQRGQPMDVWPVANLTAQLAVALLLPTSDRGRWLRSELGAGFNEFQVGRDVPQISPTRTMPRADCGACANRRESAPHAIPDASETGRDRSSLRGRFVAWVERSIPNRAAQLILLAIATLACVALLGFILAIIIVPLLIVAAMLLGLWAFMNSLDA